MNHNDTIKRSKKQAEKFAAYHMSKPMVLTQFKNK